MSDFEVMPIGTKNELDFLRFFYSYMSALHSAGGTDETYWATEAYTEQTGREAPEVSIVQADIGF